MGQKVNPHGLRVGVIKGWDTQWYADKKEFAAYLKEDNVIRTFIKKKYYAAAISKILIERTAGKIVVTVYTGRPGVLIGKAGAEIEVIKKDLAKLTKGKPVAINVTEVRKPDADAQLVAESVAAQLGEEIEKYREQTFPAIIQIPGVSGNTGAGVENVKKTVEQAVGSDILFSAE